MFHIQFDSSQPIYSQVIEEVKRALVIGKLSPGDKLSSQRELAEILKVNPNTIQRAYREMENLGLVETLRGQGTYIRENPSLVKTIKEEMTMQVAREFVCKMQGLGWKGEEIQKFVEEIVKEEREAIKEVSP